MYAITHFNRGQLTIEARYNKGEKLNAVQKLTRKLYTQENLLCALVVISLTWGILTNF